MRKQAKQRQTTGVLSVQKAFEQFQRANIIKNLSPATIGFYSSKMQRFFDFIEDTAQPLELLTEITVDDYTLYPTEIEPAFPAWKAGALAFELWLQTKRAAVNSVALL